ILGLLRLPKEVQNLVATNQISMGHARVLSKLEDENQISDMALKIIENNLSVRDVERLANGENFEKNINIIRRIKETDKNYKYVKRLLSDKLDAKIKIDDKKIGIFFNSVADLNRILEIINVKEQ